MICDKNTLLIKKRNRYLEFSTSFLSLSCLKHTRLMGHIAHLQKTFLSNKHFTSRLVKHCYYVILEREIFKCNQCIFAILLLSVGPFTFEQPWIPLNQGYFVPLSVKICPVALERMIFKCHQCVFTISRLSLLGKGHGPSTEQTWIPFIQGCFVPRFSWDFPWDSGEDF